MKYSQPNTLLRIAPSEKDTDNAGLDYDAFGRIYEYFLGERNGVSRAVPHIFIVKGSFRQS